MSKETETLREALIQIRNGRSRWRCPSRLREEIVRYSQSRRSEGWPIRKIAEELGLSKTGLSRWLDAASGRLRPVRVMESAPPRSLDLVLITPQGFRLEGLSTASAADLLRQLGC